jgi:hypothetical protein
MPGNTEKATKKTRQILIFAERKGVSMEYVYGSFMDKPHHPQVIRPWKMNLAKPRFTATKPKMRHTQEGIRHRTISS